MVLEEGSEPVASSWADPASNDDPGVNGANVLSTDNPEITSVQPAHRRPIQVGIEVLTGVPVDEITLRVEGA